jgi:hypothetical protein
MTAVPLNRYEPPSAKLLQDYRWWIFCFIIFCLKLVLLGIDPNPKLFMGDSGSYLWTALSGWIPPDRSFLYGFVIRWVSLTTHSLNSLLLLQAFLAANTAILLAFICRRFFLLSAGLSYGAGFVCAIDPLQLIWERYVMTETISLFLYAAMLAFSFSYLRNRQLWQLALVQIFALLAITFRISYLLVVDATTVALPLAAFMPLLWTGSVSESRARVAKSLVVHLAFSILLMLGLHLGYKEVNGFLSDRPPAYLYSSGLSILAVWAPALQPNDSPDPRLAQIISQGKQFHLANIRLRNSQLYSKDYLIDRWQNAAGDPALADQIAKQTALQALLHRPTAILSLGCRTFLGYFDSHQLHQQAKSDLGRGDWPKPITHTMASRLRLAPPARGEAKSHTTLQKYFLAAQPYYCVVVFCPVFCGVLLFFVRETYVFVLFLHGCIFLATDSLLAVTASVRYLQPLSFLAILVFALFVNYFIQRRPFARSSMAL